jgi:hypothetical protein
VAGAGGYAEDEQAGDLLHPRILDAPR